MTAQLMLRPSSLMPAGVRMQEFGNIYLFKFTDRLQDRFEQLIQKHKHRQLTPDEQAEYAGISELERIFNLINAQLAATSKWCPANLENLSESELDTSASTVTPPTGRATCDRLDLNDEYRDEPSIQVARQYWVMAGWHPPTGDPQQT